MVHPLLCGVDFSEASIAAVPTVLTGLAEEPSRRRREDLQARLQRFGAGGTPITVEVQDGDAGSVLLARAWEPGKPPALLVLGPGGNDPSARPGSTAFRLLAGTRAPVLCVPLPPLAEVPVEQSETASHQLLEEGSR